MRIHTTMNLGNLAELMGDYATSDEALVMRAYLSETDYEDTSDVSEPEWLELLARSADALAF